MKSAVRPTRAGGPRDRAAQIAGGVETAGVNVRGNRQIDMAREHVLARKCPLANLSTGKGRVGAARISISKPATRQPTKAPRSKPPRGNNGRWRWRPAR